ncbi:MAG: hypothetical protein ABIL09_27385, partial [Gemmatimonadota bacterium]
RGRRGAGRAPEAVVRGHFAGRQHQWRGRAVRAEGEIDPRSRMVHVVVVVDDPYGASVEATAPLMVGQFVQVEIAGRTAAGVRAIPRLALRPGNTVWTAGRDGVLHLRPAQVVRSSQDEVLVRLEMEPDERVVVSQVSGVTDGMKVRLAEASGSAGRGEAAP